jgi:hypothetical protein
LDKTCPKLDKWRKKLKKEEISTTDACTMQAPSSVPASSGWVLGNPKSEIRNKSKIKQNAEMGKTETGKFVAARKQFRGLQCGF